jgi:hypothetical protein
MNIKCFLLPRSVELLAKNIDKAVDQRQRQFTIPRIDLQYNKLIQTIRAHYNEWLTDYGSYVITYLNEKNELVKFDSDQEMTDAIQNQTELHTNEELKSSSFIFKVYIGRLVEHKLDDESQSNFFKLVIILKLTNNIKYCDEFNYRGALKINKYP